MKKTQEPGGALETVLKGWQLHAALNREYDTGQRTGLRWGVFMGAVGITLVYLIIYAAVLICGR